MGEQNPEVLAAIKERADEPCYGAAWFSYFSDMALVWSHIEALEKARADLLRRVETAERERNELAAWLERHSTHPHGCPARSGVSVDCTCGLSALLDRIGGQADG